MGVISKSNLWYLTMSCSCEKSHNAALELDFEVSEAGFEPVRGILP